MANKIVSLSGEVNEEMYGALLDALVKNRHSSDELVLVINTEGGDEQIGLAMYDLIRTYPHHVSGLVVGRCHSAGTLILLACDDRRCTPNAQFLFHLGSGSYETPEELSQILYADRQWNALVAERTGARLKDVIRWHRRETFFNATEALVHSIVNKIEAKAAALWN